MKIYPYLFVLLFLFIALNGAISTKVNDLPETNLAVVSTPSPYKNQLEPTITSTPHPMQGKSLSKIPPSNSSQSDEWGKTVKLDEHTSASRFAPDDHMSTSPELFSAMNAYRSSHGVQQVNSNGTLCSIAQSRASEQVANGGLDSHAGFSKYAHSQTEFNNMSEVLFGGTQPVSGVHVVEWGWDTSVTGHREAISNPNWTHGCAGIAGYFAVFIFGTN